MLALVWSIRAIPATIKRWRGYKLTRLEDAMVELTRTNDPVLLSWLVAALASDDIESLVFDAYASVIEGSISAIQRRVMVDEADLPRAKRVLAEAIKA